MVVPKKGTSTLLARPCRVAVRCELLVASFLVGSECELQESVAAITECAFYESGCWFARATVGFVVILRVCVGVSRRLREPTCGVAFTGAGLWSVEPVEGVLALLVVPSLWGRDSLSQEFVAGRLWWRLVPPCVASSCRRALASGCLASVVGVRLAMPLMGVLALCCCFLFCVWERPVACLLPPFSMGCSDWWCSTMAFVAVLRTMATFVAKVPPLELP
ncbi:hypothetical protein Taro_041674 [Colocasia esculenta]|uniref:Uncharacterized protein n=1 Tax=Colocasia esculenta TaxID=4460 RepID=A0A843WM21_COLES|nr:hypothetical protein [Colocasia esculenta]